MAIFGKKKEDEPVVARYGPGGAPAAVGGVPASGSAGAAATSGGATSGSAAVSSAAVSSAAVSSATGGAAAPKEEGSRLIVGPNIRLAGSEITDCDTVIVEGRVEATVEGRVMQIAETGTFSGTVGVDMAEIRGQFQGELTVRKRLTVCGTGKVQGKIRYGALVVEEGGELSGDVDSLNMPPTSPASTASTATAKEVKTGPTVEAKPGVTLGITRLPG